ncbi:MAG: diaminopimelate epimerase, partial [Elusimicrobia bacterium]|nr:diaminopimelate epimerase [Elusimicrobiota bacterium]
MKKIPFTKMQGTGNDFVVLDGFRMPVRVTPMLARGLCDRRFGVGADQVLVLAPSRVADFKMLIFNADGSQVEMCGNGIRCVARYACETGRVKKKAMTVETLAGVRSAVLDRSGVRVDMGAPILDARRIPTTAEGRVLQKPFVVRPGAGQRPVRLEVTAV